MSDSPFPPNPITGDNGDIPEQSRDARPVSGYDAAQLRREKFALRRLLRDMSNGEHELERKLQAFEATELDAKKTIESRSRAVHWGREPERPWAWGAAAPRADGPDRVSWQALGRGADAVSADGVLRRHLRKSWKRISRR